MAQSLGERWVEWRNGWLMSPRFQAWSWRWPLFRTVARRRAAYLFDLVAGFTYSQLLFAGVRLGLFEMLRERPLSMGEIARRCELPEPSAARLLRGLRALGLVEPLGDDRHALGQHGAALVANPGVLAMIAHHDLLYADLVDPVALLRGRGGGQLSRYWPYAEGRRGEVGPYSQLMAASQPMVAASVLEAFDFRPWRCLLDVGGGEGAFLKAVGARHPHLALKLFDLPDVARRAADSAPWAGQPIETHGGSFTQDPLPDGADLISLVRILHDHDDDVVLGLLRRVREALPNGSRVLIAEPMADAAGAQRMGDAYFGLYLLAMGSGRPRTAHEIGAMLRSTGFRKVQQHPTRNPFATQLLSAEPDT